MKYKTYTYKCNGQVIDSFLNSKPPSEIGDVFSLQKIREKRIVDVRYKVISRLGETYECEEIGYE